MENSKEIVIDGKVINAVRVSSITPVGPRSVYNMEVDIDHNYYANGMLTANSTYHSLLDHYSKKYGEELYKIKDTFITYKHRRLLIYPSGPNKKTLRGRCLTGDTLVNTNYGFLKLSELISFEGFRPVSGLHVDSPCGSLLVSHTFKEQVSLTYRVTTELGLTIQGTPEHPVLTNQGWLELSQLKIGDEILVRADNDPRYGLSVITEEEFQTVLTSDLHELPPRIRQANKDSLITFLHRLFSPENPKYRGDLDLGLNLNHTRIGSGVRSIDSASQGSCVTVSGEIKGRLGLLSHVQIILLHLGISSRLNNDDCLKVIGNAPLTLYDRVLKVYPVREEKFVYDLTVPGHHLFTANGLTSHNTRFFSCIPGSSLISSTSGLVPMSSIQVGDKVNIGPKVATISVHKCTGTKELVKLILTSGQEFVATSEHKVVIYEDNKFKKRKISSLNKTENVVYAVGGSFPTELELPTVERPKYKDNKSALYAAMFELKSFTYTRLMEYSNTPLTREIVGPFTTKLVRAGHLTKHRDETKKHKEKDAYYYSLSKTFDLDAIIKGRNKGCYEKRHEINYPEKMSVELAYALGYLVADGYNLKTLNFKSLSEERRDHYAACVTKAFGMAPNIGEYTEENRSGRVFVNYYANITLNNWIEFFLKLGITKDYSANKVVPWSILRAPRACVIAFLQALFECDGIFTSHLMYNTISKKLALQVQQLLLTLGVPARITKNKQRYKCKEKYGNKVLHHYHVRVNSSNGDSKKLYDIFDGKLSISSIAYEGYSHDRKSDIRGDTKNKHLFTSTIRAIVPLNKSCKVYDMTVDCDEHVYQANGVLCANSVDEIGWFDHNADKKLVKMDANEVYIALDRSLLTVRAATNRLVRQGFDNIPTGYAFNISSPSSARDKIMELVTQSQHSRKLLGFKKATWEMNPEITKADLSEEFSRDPQAAERDYGCNPPLSDNAFFSSYASISGCFVGKKNKLSYNYVIKKGKDGGMTRYATIMDLAASTKPNVLAIDAGFSNNSFSMVTGHLHNGIPILTCFCEVAPLPGIPLNHALIFREVIMPLVKARNVKLLVSDRWQNIKLLQDAELEVEDLTTVSLSLKYSHFWIVKQAMFDSELVMPRLSRPVEDILKYDHSKYPLCFNDPVEHLVLQFLTVRDQGNAVVKGDNVTDDTFRCCCLAYTLLMDPEFEHIFNGEGSEVQEKASIGIVQSRGSNSRALSDVKTSAGKPLGVYARRT